MRDESRQHESLVGNLRGKVVFTSDDKEAGVVEDLLYNRLSEVPEWFILRPKNRKLSHLVLPVAGFELQNDGLKVPYSAAHIEDQPKFHIDRELEEEAETALDHYFRLGSA